MDTPGMGPDKPAAPTPTPARVGADGSTPPPAGTAPHRSHPPPYWGPGAGQTPTGPADPTAGLTGDQRNAYLALENIFEGYGLKSLAPDILKFIQQGYDSSTIGYLLQQTDAYKTRFAGNEERVKNGYAALDASSYLAVEAGYKDAAQAYGLPSGFYDDPSDFAQLIGKNISANEFATRAGYAFKYVQSQNAEARDALKQYYGVDDGHLTAYFLDPTKGQAILDRQAAAVDIGAAARKQHVAGVGRDQAESYADLGVSGDRAMAGFGQVADSINAGQLNIAQRFGSDLNQQDLSNEFVGGLASAKRKRDQLNQAEAAMFSGQSGVAHGSFGQATGAF